MIGLCIGGLLMISLKIGGYYNQVKKDEKVFKQITQVKQIEQIEESVQEETISENRLKKLKSLNEDVVGWLEIKGTAINYPVMYTPDRPQYYLNRNFYKEYSISGTPFLDEELELEPLSDNLIIYGHNMKNGSMFHTLVNYKEQTFWEQNQQITFETHKEQYIYDIFAVINVNVDTQDAQIIYTTQSFQYEKQFKQYMEAIKRNEFYQTGIEPTYGSQLITLSTCETGKDNERILVIGVRTR